HAAAKQSYGPALIDDRTPTPPHALFRRARLAQVIGVGLLLWAVPMAVAVATQGRESTLAQMGWFFTKAALLTFGGAYAVLPSVLFILAGGPLVESTHGNLKFTAPLTAITAAVVGVIGSLALFFLLQIGFSAVRIDAIALALVAAAAIALFRFRLGVIPVIG